QRQVNFNFSGPLIRNKLTIGTNGNHRVQENPNTVNATLPNGLKYELGIVNTFLSRFANVNGTYQLSNRHSISVGTNFEVYTRKNQGVGGFNLPERASNGSEHFHNVFFTQTSVLSEKTLYRTNVNLWSDNDENTPATRAVSIDVLGAFGSGGASGKGQSNRQGYYLNNLFSHAGDKVTVKAGFDGGYR